MLPRSRFGEKDDSLDDLNILKPEENPTDSVSSISWAPTSNFNWFACSDWDSKIRVYDVLTTADSNRGIQQKVSFDLEEPCLSVSWEDELTKIFAGCIDNSVKSLDMMTGKTTNIGFHDAGVRDVYWIGALNSVCSLSFDKTIKFWDLRQPSPTMAFNLNHKIYCSDMVFPNLGLGLSDEKLIFVNVMEIREVLERWSIQCLVDSPLGAGSQLRAISFFPDGSGFGVGSYEGRANLSSLSQVTGGQPRVSNIMTFKCHKTDNPQILHPVHAIGFNPRARNFLYTAGGEGSLIFWDFNSKNKIKAHNYSGVPVTQAKVNMSGSMIAYALGYDWARGVEGAKSIKPRVCVHQIPDTELVYNR